MKAKYLFVTLLLAVSVILAQPVEKGIGGQGAMLFEAGGSARSLGMGQANAALANQGEAVLYNPAGLGQIHSAKLSLFGGSLYGKTFQSVLTFNMPWATYGTFGFSYVGAFGGLEEGIDASGNPIELKESMSNSSVLISYAKKFGAFGFGVAPKLMFSQLSDEQAIGFDADLGFMFYPLGLFLSKSHSYEGTKASLPYDMITIGVAAKNLLGTTMKYSDSNMEPANPRILRAGLAGRFLDNRLNIAGDVSYTLNEDKVLGWYAGLELYPAKLLGLRFGVNHNYFTGGLGISTELARNFGLEIDYAIMLHYGSEFMLQPVHKLSLNLDLRNVAGIWLESRPAALNSPADYAEITVHGASQFKGRTKRWVFEIKDAGGNVVYRQSRDVYGEIDELPAKFTWNGVNNIRGGQVDDGTYYYDVSLIDNLGDQITYDGMLVKVEWKGIRR